MGLARALSILHIDRARRSATDARQEIELGEGHSSVDFTGSCAKVDIEAAPKF
jgi:hypothetical protein